VTSIDDGWHQYFLEPLKDLVEEITEKQFINLYEQKNFVSVLIIFVL
jgi:hypothetical protein